MTRHNDTTASASVNRRNLLKTLGFTGAAAGLSGCTDGGITPTITDTVVESTPEEIGGSLNGAVGSDVDRRRRKLYFVEESGGTIARFDLTREVVELMASGTDTISGTYTYDLDAGREGDTGNEGPDEAKDDIWWRIRDRDAGERWLDVQNDAELALIGDVNFDDVSPASLPTYDYSTDYIDGSDGSDQLTAGTVVAVKTTKGNFAKVEITSRGYDLGIKYETYKLRAPLQRIGSGYNKPADIALVGDGKTAYVTERGAGNLLEVNLGSADRSSATVVASGLTSPQQMSLDAVHDIAHVVESKTSKGRITRVDLDSGSTTVLYEDLADPVGLVVDDAREFAYVSERNGGAGVISEVELRNGRREVLKTDLASPHFLTWGDEAQSTILYTEGDPMNRISMLDIGELSVTRVVKNAPKNPRSVSLDTPSTGIICSDATLSEFDYGSGLYAGAPLFMGIGHIPVGYISQSSDVPRSEAGYATTQGSGFPLQTRDAAFGRTLPLMLNHYQAYTARNARYYRVFVDGNRQERTWTALQWSARTGRQEPVDVSPSGNGYYEVRRPGQLWFRPRLGYKLPTGGLSNGLHTITVAFYGSRSSASKITEESVEVRIDNQAPNAELGRIFHRKSDGTDEVVDACAIVDTATDEFQFEVTANDPQRHLRAWRLVALWGNNESDLVASEGYTDPNGNKKWAGPRSERKPAGSYWSATSRQCAHTFYLRAWGRVTNGYHHIHHDRYHKSITLMLP